MPLPGVADLHHDLAGLDARRNREPPAFRHRVARVQEQVEEGPLLPSHRLEKQGAGLVRAALDERLVAPGLESGRARHLGGRDGQQHPAASTRTAIFVNSRPGRREVPAFTDMTAHHEGSADRCQARPSEPLRGAADQHAPDRLLDVAHIAIDLDVDLEQKTVRRHPCDTPSAWCPTSSPSFTLDAVALAIESVSADGSPVPFVHHGKRIVVRPPAPWRRGESHVLVIAYRGTPAARPLLRRARRGAIPTSRSRCGRRARTRTRATGSPASTTPHEKATSEVIVTVPAGLFALSNGGLVTTARAGEQDRTLHWRLDVPHSCYLVTLAVGDFAAIDDALGRRPAVVPRPSAGARRTASARSARTPADARAVLGGCSACPTRTRKYAQVFVADFIFGGMENTTRDDADRHRAARRARRARLRRRRRSSRTSSRTSGSATC